MLSVRFLSIVSASALLLLACSGNNNSGTSQNSGDGSIQLYGAKVATTAAKLPNCDSTQVGQLFFVLADQEFQFCSNDGYQTIDLRGAEGTDGIDGSDGTVGEDGVDGKDGSSCSVITNKNSTKTILCEDGTTATVSDGASCEVADNSDGSYDLTCSGTTVTVKDGKDGLNGTNGTNGKDGESCFASKRNDSLFVDCSGVLDTIVDGLNGVDGSSCTVSDDGAGSLTQTCTDGTSVSWKSIPFCENQIYDPETHFCASDIVTPLCGGLEFDPALQFCYEDDLQEYYHVYTLAELTFLGNTLPDYCATEGNCGTLSDPRDGNVYRWTKIGGQVWMAENMAYLPDVNELSENSETDPRYYVYKYLGTNVSDAKSFINGTYVPYSSFGVLYNYNAAIQVCPTGWHLPTDLEWQTLEIFIGMLPGSAYESGWRGTDQGKQLKSASWNNSTWIGTDNWGFSILPAGAVGSGFSGDNIWAYLWTATTTSASSAIYRRVGDNYENITRYPAILSFGFSVRCLKGAY